MIFLDGIKVMILLFLTFCNKIKSIKIKKKEYKKIYYKKNVYSVKKLFVMSYEKRQKPRKTSSKI